MDKLGLGLAQLVLGRAPLDDFSLQALVGKAQGAGAVAHDAFQLEGDRPIASFAKDRLFASPQKERETGRDDEKGERGDQAAGGGGRLRRPLVGQNMQAPIEQRQMALDIDIGDRLAIRR